eukprot:4958656-Pleurochrysis_carterae.AAC.1
MLRTVSSFPGSYLLKKHSNNTAVPGSARAHICRPLRGKRRIVHARQFVLTNTCMRALACARVCTKIAAACACTQIARSTAAGFDICGEKRRALTFPFGSARHKSCQTQNTGWREHKKLRPDTREGVFAQANMHEK